MVVDAMESKFPFRHHGPLTALRTVLLTAARTTWLLNAPKRAERQLRAIMLEIQNQIEQRKAISGLTGDHMSADLVEGRNQAVALINDHIAALRVRGAALSPDGEIKQMPDTASLLQGLVDEHSLEGQGIRHLWRTGSATAHGFHWAAKISGQPGNFDEVWFNTSLYGSMLLIKDAIELYEKRATNWIGRA
ncbi:hypothetical protein ACTWP6_26665 [Mycobacterium sp. 4D054]|uniref:hypothetical protein n=1 Tax=Mycobacterium sp. 4D054 TaxID=3457440 RepID=UPI003FD6AD92